MAYRYGGETVVGRVGARGLAATLVAPPLIPVAPGEQTSSARVQRAPLRCPELDCLRGHLPSPTLERAERRAAAIGVCADRVLIAMGAITEEDYVAAFATRHGISFEPLNHRPRAACPISDAQLIETAVTGLLPLTMGDDLAFVVVPQLVDSRRLAAALAAPTALTRRIRVTSLPRLQRFVARHAAREIEHRAERALHEVRPELSARGKMLPILTLTVLAFLIAIGAFAAPYATLLASEIAFAGLFLAWTSLRIFGLWSERLVRRRRRTVRDDWLPTYTVIVPLYREAAALAGLIAALRRLDYPVLGSKLEFAT